MKVLRQNTQATIKVGPLLDSSDYKTRETGFNSASTGLDIDVYKYGGAKVDLAASASSSEAGYFAHNANGNYYLTLSSDSVDTVGSGGIDITVTGALPYSVDTLVIDEASYDALVAGSDSGATAPTVEEIDAQLSSTHSSGSWAAGSCLGTGALSFLYTVTDSCTAAALSEVLVEVTSSSSTRNANRVAAWLTDAFGNVTFQLDAGTYYFWRKKSGYYFDDPDTETVSS